MATAVEPVSQAIRFEAVRTRTRRECRLFSRALMRVPLVARIVIGIGLAFLAIASLYFVFIAGLVPVSLQGHGF